MVRYALQVDLTAARERWWVSVKEGEDFCTDSGPLRDIVDAGFVQGAQEGRKSVRRIAYAWNVGMLLSFLDTVRHPPALAAFGMRDTSLSAMTRVDATAIRLPLVSRNRC
jgi:hypothetical protein